MVADICLQLSYSQQQCHIPTTETKHLTACTQCCPACHCIYTHFKNLNFRSCKFYQEKQPRNCLETEIISLHGWSLPYAPAPRSPMISTHTMTGAVNLSSNRNNMLTNMAITSPLTERSDRKERNKGRISIFFFFFSYTEIECY